MKNNDGSDIAKAIGLLRSHGFTCVLCRGEKVYMSEKPGISPMLDFIGEGLDLCGFSAADKIIGRAAAMLFAAAGVVSVYGEVMSMSALPVLEKYGILYSYGTLTDVIINRKKDGICPMELAVSGIDDPQAAVCVLRAERDSLASAKKV